MHSTCCLPAVLPGRRPVVALCVCYCFKSLGVATPLRRGLPSVSGFMTPLRGAGCPACWRVPASSTAHVMSGSFVAKTSNTCAP